MGRRKFRGDSHGGRRNPFGLRKTNPPRKILLSHIGLITDQPKPNEVLVEATRVWITDFAHHPFHIEWLRFEPDSPVTGPVREQPHVAYRVALIEQAAKGLKTLLEPFRPLEGLRVGFYESSDGAVIEFMEYDREPFAGT